MQELDAVFVCYICNFCNKNSVLFRQQLAGRSPCSRGLWWKGATKRFEFQGAEGDDDVLGKIENGVVV